jgi:GGDEF domain-containing protein
LALVVLACTPINEIEVQAKSKFIPMFDFNVLERYRIDMSVLPDDSVIINTPTSTYQAVCNRILKDLSHHAFATVGLVAVSIGVSSLNGTCSNEELINRADKRLYKAKGNGRDQVVAGD